MLWSSGYSIGRLAELACLLEVSASKPGNVHRGADFEDVTFTDFAVSAVALGQAIDECVQCSYGTTVLSVAKRTVAAVNSNTNLGINLLFSAMAKAAATASNSSGQATEEAVTATATAVTAEHQITTDAMRHFLSGLSASDAAQVFEAIRLMNPSGLGEAYENDVRKQPAGTLLEAMDAAKDRDLVAAQFSNGFADVFEKTMPWILEGRDYFGSLMQGIVLAHVRLMAEVPDSLIARKNGIDLAVQSQLMAQKCVDAADQGPTVFFEMVSNLDFWLRSDGHKRNPGTTADLIAAGLFAGLLNGKLTPPFN
jgi:triphosphoribosyl-dephospho-CoA synthase